MAEGSDRNRDHLRAGIFVIVAVALAIGTFVSLQKFSWTSRTTYRLRFALENGVTGLSIGSEVRVGGLRRGSIKSIVPISDNGRLARIDVDFDLDASITLYGNAEALRVAPILGNTAWINLTSVGSPYDVNHDGTIGPNEGALAEGGELMAIEAPGLLANVVGSKSAAEIVTIITRAETFSEVLEQVPADYNNRIVPALDDARALIGQIRTDYGQWRTKVESTLTSAETAADNLAKGTESANKFIADAHAVLAENRDGIKSSVANIESASHTAREVAEALRTNTIPQIAELLTRGESAVGDFADLLNRLDGEIAARLPDLRSFLADMRVAAGQLKLATIEVRRSPWRLLYRPSTDVLANEQLYEATRSFASASADLRSAADGLQEVLRVRPDLIDDIELRGRLQQSLIEALSRYEESQRRLHGVLTDDDASRETK